MTRWSDQPDDRHTWAFFWFCKRQGDDVRIENRGNGVLDIVMTWKPDARTMCYTDVKFQRVVDACLDSRDPESGNRVISFDVETFDQGYPDVHLTGFSLGGYDRDGELFGAYVPTGHTPGPNISEEIWKDGLRQLLEDPDTWVVGHNLKYDIKVARLFGIEPTEQVYDTWICEWLLNTPGVGSRDQRLYDKGQHGLKPVVEHWFGHEMIELDDFCEYDSVRVGGGNRKVYRTHETDVDEMGPYAADDAVWPLKLRDHQRRRFERGDRKLADVYNDIERELIFCLTEMEEWGVEIRSEVLAEMGDRMDDQLDDIHREMYEARDGQDFEPVDPATVVDVVDAYGTLEERFDLPRDHPDYPRNQKTGKPRGKGWMRNRMFEEYGVDDHGLEEKVRDAFASTAPLEDHLRKWPDIAHKIFNTNSNHVLNEVLFGECGIEPVGKQGPTGLYSTEAELIAEWADEHPIAANLNKKRELSKLRNTYVKGILDRLSDDHRLRTRFNRPIATGRLSSRDPNLQNIIKSDEFPIRLVFVSQGVAGASMDVIQTNDNDEPLSYRVYDNDGGVEIHEGQVSSWWGDPPWVMLVADYSQLEIRLLAHFSEDPGLVEPIKAGKDIHGTVTVLVFDEVPDDTDPNDVKGEYPKWRDRVKPINFGIVYGMTEKTLAKRLGVDIETAEEYMESYLGNLTGVQRWIQEQHDFAVNHGFVRTLAGRKRHIPLAPYAYKKKAEYHPKYERNEYMDWKYRLHRAERIAQNTPIQGSAADVIHTAMIEIRKFAKTHSPVDVVDEFTEPNGEVDHEYTGREPLWGNWMRMLLNVHDELVFEFHPAIANWALAHFPAMMSNAWDVRVPLDVDAKLGVDWHNTKD